MRDGKREGAGEVNGGGREWECRGKSGWGSGYGSGSGMGWVGGWE